MVLVLYPTLLKVGFSLVLPTCGSGAGGVMYLAQGIFEGSTTQTTTDRSNKYFSFDFPFSWLSILLLNMLVLVCIFGSLEASPRKSGRMDNEY